MSESTREELFYIEEFAGTRLPVHTSEIMPSLEDPAFVPAQKSTENRERDCVLGVTYNGITRAYPLWIMDNYHVANDTFGDTPLTVIHCERCSSGAAYFATVDGQRLTFQVAGIWKMTLIIRDEETNSFWAHSEGVALEGPLKGTILKRFPCYQTTWEEWRRLHPETTVLSWPENKLHRDGRHGHGARDYMGRPGIRAGESLGVTPEWVDERIPENAMVLGLRATGAARAYPLDEVHRGGGVINDTLLDEPVVIWSTRFDSHIMAAFSRNVAGVGPLTFTLEESAIVDAETGSEWSTEGTAIGGELAGRQLEPVDWVFLKWHAWSPFHPDTELFQAGETVPESELQTDVFGPVFQAVRAGGVSLQIEGRVVKALLPNLAVAGVSIRLSADPFQLFLFEDHRAAEEYRWCEPHSSQVGRFVLKSEPETQFADNAQLILLPDTEINWSSLLTDRIFRDLLNKLRKIPPEEELSLGDFLEELKQLGYGVELKQQLEGRRLPVRAHNGYEVAINGYPFLFYRFEDPYCATDFSTWHGKTITAEQFALRSDPPDQYKVKGLEAVTLPDDKVSWSPLLTDEGFAIALRSVVGTD